MSLYIGGNVFFFVFFFKQKTAYELRISDWSSDLCSADLGRRTTPASRAGRARSTGTPSDAGSAVPAHGPSAGGRRASGSHDRRPAARRPPAEIGRAHV